MLLSVLASTLFLFYAQNTVENELDTHYANHHIMVAVVMMHHTILMSNTSPLLHMCF